MFKFQKRLNSQNNRRNSQFRINNNKFRHQNHKLLLQKNDNFDSLFININII